MINSIVEYFRVLYTDPNKRSGCPHTKHLQPYEEVVKFYLRVIPAVNNRAPQGVKHKPTSSKSDCKVEGNCLFTIMAAEVSQVGDTHS